jgi:hypothetical protein
MATALMLVLFALAIALTLLSAWTFSIYAYRVIVLLFASGFLLDLASEYLHQGTWNSKTIAIDGCVFGALFYFVTVQKVMGRKVSEVATNDTYKAFLLENNKYNGFLRMVYYLPFVLVAVGVCAAVYWKYLV